MKKIIIVANWSDVETNKGFDRLSYLAKTFASNGYKTTLVTSDFDHHSKKFKKINENIKRNYSIKLVSEIGYSNNIGFKRILSHLIFALNIKKLLSDINYNEKPDAIYVTMPFSVTTLVCKAYCKKLSIPLIVDVEDLWPEALVGITNLPSWITKAAVFPWQFLSNRAYKAADAIVSHNDTYLNRALKNAKNGVSREMVYLGADINFTQECIDNYANEIEKEPEEFWVAYVGSLAENYDLDTMIYAVKLLKEKGYKNIKLMFLGTGTYEERLEELCKKNEVSYHITGRIEYPRLIAYLSKSDVAVNAIKNQVIVISYKTNDYFSVGLPIINSSRGELQDILDKYNAGYYYEVGNSNMLAKFIEKLYLDKELHNKMKRNSKEFAVKYLDKQTNYLRIVNLVNNLIRK